eukprot:m.478373 g.478373  ORF g.478373 m.478373 type:complete len:285 (-) comp21132_c0_seq1:143-997(-)
MAPTEDVQKRTFTNWVNLTLKSANLKVEDLQFDLADGHTLIVLVETLSGKSIGKYTKLPAFVTSGSSTTKGRQEMIHFQENIDKCLAFLRTEENVKIVNIGGEDIVKGNMRCILGLIWTLILKYHIADGSDGKNAAQAKSELLDWIRGLIGPGTKYGLDIKNFTTDWEDGKALLALCDAMDGGAGAGDWSADGDDAERTAQAIALANKEMFVPSIIESGDVGVDELSMVAYLDFFRDNQDAVEKKVRKREGAQARAVSKPSAAAGQTGGFSLKPGSSRVRATWN